MLDKKIGFGIIKSMYSPCPSINQFVLSNSNGKGFSFLTLRKDYISYLYSFLVAFDTARHFSSIAVSYVNYGGQQDFGLNFSSLSDIIKSSAKVGENEIQKKPEANRFKTSSQNQQTGGQYATQWWLPALPARQRNRISLFLFQKADRFIDSNRSGTGLCSRSIQKYSRESSSRTFTGSGIKRYCKSLNLYYKSSTIYSGYFEQRAGSIFKKSSTQNENDNRIDEVIRFFYSLTKPWSKVRKSGLVFLWCKVRVMAHQLLGFTFCIFSSFPNNTFPIPANGRIK